MAEIPYYQPVAPVTPVADHTAAQLIAHIGNQGLQAFVSMAQARQRSELEEKALQQRAVLAEQEFGLTREKMAIDLQLKSRDMAREEMLANSHAGYYDAMAGQYTAGELTAKQRTIEFNQQLFKTKEEAANYANELNLTNPEFQTKNPVQFAANLQKFEDAYGTAPPQTGVSDFISQQRTLADQQKIEISIAGDKQKMPIWQVVRGLKDPKTHDLYKQALLDSGMMTEEQVPTEGRTKDWKHPIDTLWDMFVKGKSPTKTVEKPSDFIKPWLESGKTTDWGHVASRVPMTMARTASTYVRPPAGGGPGPRADSPDVQQAAATLNNETLLPEQTETDMKLAAARDAIAKGAPREAVAARLREMGIDETQL